MFRFVLFVIALISIAACQSTPEKASTEPAEGQAVPMSEIMESFEKQFAAMDQDKSGSINRKEVEAHLNQEFDQMDLDRDGALGEVQHVIDSDNDGKFEKAEYVKSQSALLFDKTDANKDATLQKEELRAHVLKVLEQK